MNLKACPHCGGTHFEGLQGNYGLICMDEKALDESGTFGSHTTLLPLSVSICTNCNHLAISYNHMVKNQRL